MLIIKLHEESTSANFTMFLSIPALCHSSVKVLEPRAAPRCHLPRVVMCTSVSANTCFTDSSCSCFTTSTRYVLVPLGWYPANEGP